MIVGKVAGVQQIAGHVRCLVEHDGREQVILLCSSPEARAIRIDDFLWTQGSWAMWSSDDLGVKDKQLALHRTLFNGKHPCCDPK